eukprot:5914296-Pyramimonas_sp.AAC.1
MATIISHNDIAFPVHCHSTRRAEPCSAAVSVAMAHRAVARQCGHHTLRRDLSNTMAVPVGHDDIAAPVHCHSIRAAENKGVAHSIMIAAIGHNDIAVPVHCHSIRTEELSGGALSVSIARPASPRQCGHQALRRDPADTMVARVRHKNVALPINCHSSRAVEPSGGGAPSVSMAPHTSPR